MKERVEYVTVPSDQQTDWNPQKTRWKDGNCVALDEGTHVTLFIGHHKTQLTEIDGDGSEHEVIETKAFPVRVAKPLSRDMAINAAEMAAYHLNSAMEVASFNASLGRKHRANKSDSEVIEHDQFISWVKQELTKIGI